MRRTAMLLTLAAALPLGVRAQQVGDLAAGDTVRFLTKPPAVWIFGFHRRPETIVLDPTWNEGTVARLVADSLVTRSSARGVALNRVLMMYVSRGRTSRMGNLERYVFVGVAAGAFIAAAANADDQLGIFQFLPRVAFGGLVGGIGGAAVGLTRPGPRLWVELALPPLRPKQSQPPRDE
jgi:hypothetical protein